MTGKYAKDTNVSCENSRAEIEKILKKYGADSFSYGWDYDRAVIYFKIKGKFIRFILTLPDRKSKEFTHCPMRGGWLKARTEELAEKSWEQACRQKWRALALVIKAKLEAVDAEISIIEQEFLANIVMPDQRTVSEHVMPLITDAYQRGIMPVSMLAIPDMRKG